MPKNNFILAFPEESYQMIKLHIIFVWLIVQIILKRNCVDYKRLFSKSLMRNCWIPYLFSIMALEKYMVS